MLALGVAALAATGCRKPTTPAAEPAPEPEVAAPAERVVSVRRGIASHYGAQFAGRRTASGELYDPSEFSAAHRTLPFGTRVRVSRVGGGPAVIVRINDRGPFSEGKLIDLSAAAARELGMMGTVARVRMEVLRGTGDVGVQASLR